ncbi:MAG: aminotransferase class I/II-fold pyridoxal phosphate-dependent enzyme [Bryobacteraceae bacterium]
MSSSATAIRERFRSRRISRFGESVIREMTRLAMRQGATNLAQGFPDFPAPAALKQAAAQAIADDINQYAITWGAKPFRDSIAAKYLRTYAMEFDPEREFRCFRPAGAYYVMTDISAFGASSDLAFVRHLIDTIGVAAVPGSSFYAQSGGGDHQVRFCFCKKYETLEVARHQLAKVQRA